MIFIAMVITAFVGFVATPSFAEEAQQKIEASVKRYSVGLNKNRIIYEPSSKGSVIYVDNPNDYPVLVQSAIRQDQDSNDTSPPPFLVTPPLFRLDSHQRSGLKVIMTEDKDKEAASRERLYWLCTTGIPPEQGDEWIKDREPEREGKAMLNVNVRATQCIKLIVRPSSLKGTVTAAANSVVWTLDNGKLKGHNDSPYYINFNSIMIDGKPVDVAGVIPPMGTRLYPLAKGVTGTHVTWTVITDVGGESAPYEYTLGQ